MVRSMMSQTTPPKSFWDYALESAARILNMVPTKKVEKTPYENSFINQEASGNLEDLEIIHEEDTHPSKNTSSHHEEDDLEIDEPLSDVNPIRRPEYDKWLDAMNVEMQSMKDNKVWDLVDLPSNDKSVGSKWLFKKKTEYITAFDASKEGVWVRKFIFGLNIIPTIKEPIIMYCDNTGAIDIANESGITKGARHFRAKVHYLRKVIEYGDIKQENFHTYDDLADPFTKALAFPKHSEYTMNIGMLPASSLV
ncbi:hypothetical protein Tco_1298195 [Tanacetum coccineum]